MVSTELIVLFFGDNYYVTLKNRYSVQNSKYNETHKNIVLNWE